MEKLNRNDPQHKLNHPSFLQPTDISSKVWRYMDLAKFVWLLEHQELFFPNIQTLPDKFEGSHTKLYVDHMSRFCNSFEDSDRIKKEMSQISLNARRTMYVNCWNLGIAESDAMWRLYCPNDQGVVIQTTYQKLVESIEELPDVHIGMVIYLDYESEALSNGGILFDQVMQKRLSYSHEQEIRLVKWLSLKEMEKTPNGVSVTWPASHTIENIYINPYAPEYFKDVVESLVRKFDDSMTERIRWSQMRSIPIYGI